jgi:hypothetical protein
MTPLTFLLVLKTETTTADRNTLIRYVAVTSGNNGLAVR